MFSLRFEQLGRVTDSRRCVADATQFPICRQTTRPAGGNRTAKSAILGSRRPGLACRRSRNSEGRGPFCLPKLVGGSRRPIAVPALFATGSRVRYRTTAANRVSLVIIRSLELERCANLKKVALRTLAIFELIDPARVDVEITLPYCY